MLYYVFSTGTFFSQLVVNFSGSKYASGSPLTQRLRSCNVKTMSRMSPKVFWIFPTPSCTFIIHILIAFSTHRVLWKCERKLTYRCLGLSPKNHYVYVICRFFLILRIKVAISVRVLVSDSVSEFSVLVSCCGPCRCLGCPVFIYASLLEMEGWNIYFFMTA